ncbi:superoxide dismutase [Kribbella sp. NPDC004875]|uniref:superoxide dismutase n=1 Tax=Kribbella sp. NPDC004875 TaxID=3364107 RepID=UPI0036C18F70
MKRLAVLTVLAATTLAIAPSATPSASASATHRPTEYVVSTVPGDTPEGITVTPDGTMYVTSVGTGAVYRGTTRTPKLTQFLPAGSDGRTSATGVHVDRWGRVLIAGASTSKLFLYDARGRLLDVRRAAAGSFLNDFTIAGDAVYVTDSATNQIWRAPLTRDGLGELEPWITRDAIRPTPYFLNGIVTDGRVLLVGEQGQDVTYRIDLRTKQVTVLDVPNGILSGDGYLLEGHRLYAVYNAGGGKYVTRLAILNHDLTQATLVADSAPGTAGATPTTIARDRDRLLWVNSQLDGAPGTPPYTVSVVPGLR